MNSIFLNFRVGDGQDTAVLIDQKLCRVFGADNVFRSSRTIRAGVAFETVLLQAVAGCAVCLVVIGPNWLARDEQGNRRIDQPGDWVRTEIEIALAAGKPVIPILVGDRKMPAEQELPETIRALAGLQNIRLHHRSAEFDLLHIADEVRVYIDPAGARAPKGPDSVLLATLAAAGRSSDVHLGPADISGRHYSDSVIYRCSVFAQAPRGTISYNLGMNYRLFQATAGVLDDAADAGQTGIFQVIADGTVREQVTVRQGQPRVLTVDITDMLRLQLVCYRPGTTENPLLAGARVAGGLSNHLPELAWGNPAVHS